MRIAEDWVDQDGTIPRGIHNLIRKIQADTFRTASIVARQAGSRNIAKRLNYFARSISECSKYILSKRADADEVVRLLESGKSITNIVKIKVR